jgi:hypothetical protein
MERLVNTGRGVDIPPLLVLGFVVERLVNAGRGVDVPPFLLFFMMMG